MSADLQSLIDQLGQALGRGDQPGAVFIPVPSQGSAPPRFGERANNVFVRTFSLTTARTNTEVKATGNFIWAIAGSDDTANLNVKFNDEFNTAFPVSRGLTMGGFRFDRLFLNNAVQAGKTLTLVYGVQEPGSNLFINNPSQQLSTVSLSKASGFQSHANVVPTTVPAEILAADPTRRAAHIQSIALANTRIGDASVSTIRGYRLPTNGTLTVLGTASIWAATESSTGNLNFVTEHD